MKKHLIEIGVIIIFIIVGLIGCIDEYVQGTGIIEYKDFEGGFYGIVEDNGKHYDPINLPSEFKEDGLRVRFTLEILEDHASIHQWGIIVKIIRIEKL
jgi:hypothetical protein